MKLLHTSDWHLGATFHDRSREHDEEHALNQIVTLARERAVDVVIIAGDIFDTANPGAVEQRRWYRTLQQLICDANVGTVVAIAGNHDSGLRLEAPRELLASQRVEVRGLLARDADPLHSIVPLRDRSGNHRAWCALVPYLREGDLQVESLKPIAEDRPQRMAQALHRRWNEIRAAIPTGLPWIVVSHAFATGGSTGGSEAPVLVEVGKLGKAEVATLADGCVYAAFGHLHRPQSIADRPHWRYSGALLPTGFDEAGSERSVVIATLADDCHTPAAIEVVPLTPYRQYRRLIGSPTHLLASISALPMPASDDPQPWLQCIVHLDEPLPDLARTIREAAERRHWISVGIQRHCGGTAARTVAATSPLPELEHIDPVEVLRMFHQQIYNTDPSAALLGAFKVLLTTVQIAGHALKLT